MGDHPRGCGEHWSSSEFQRAVAGPSPRVRGAHRHRHRYRGGPGTIPAGAGSTTPSTPARSAARDHLRGCGEHVRGGRDGVLALGPSPRVQGAYGVAADRVGGRGTIPAGAGSTRPRSSPKDIRWDHPRGCGKHLQALTPLSGRRGPSPRVRGAPVHRRGDGAGGGTIPAGAGNTDGSSRRTAMRRDHPAGAGSTTSRRSSSPRARDHPRGCGEHHENARPAGGGQGPSPRVRGARSRCRGGRSRGGTIPAGAGSTGGRSPGPRSSRDHSRGCGEHFLDTINEYGTQGPSLRVRGARHRQGAPVAAEGTIPAGAGSTPRLGFSSPAGWDHPRGCGEHKADQEV